MRKLASVVLFLILLTITGALAYLITGLPFPTAETRYLWFYSGIVMVLFSMFFIEPFYTAPTNVMANGFAILLLLISVRRNVGVSQVGRFGWQVIFIYTFSLFLASLAAMVLSDKQKSLDSLPNYLSENLKEISVKFGSGKILYSANFLYFILLYQNAQTSQVLFLMIYWWLIVVADPQKLVDKLGITLKGGRNEVAEIFSVQAGRMFLAKLFKDKSAVNKFDLVQFRHSMDEGSTHTGLVFDNYLLNEETWVKILAVETSESDGRMKDNVVYKNPGVKLSSGEDLLERFVGTVVENSEVGSIRFEVSSRSHLLQEGDLLETKVKDKTIYYQIVNGVTDKRILETKNEAGFIRGEAIQLGVWNRGQFQFEKFGWVPEINSMVLKAKTDFEDKKFEYPQYRIGKFPGTNLPATIDLHDATSHHLAVLGITGAGKSFITREIIRQLLSDTKVICVDFTGEYAKELTDLKPEPLIKSDRLGELEDLMAKKADAGGKVAQLKLRKEIEAKLSEYVSSFMKAENNMGLFELPDLSNTSFILEFTQLFLDSVFRFAKDKEKNPDARRICIVIEEAHTVIPETSSLGDLGDFGSNKALVNKIGQIALQGRKYHVGFIVVAQRTANVSKTVLTQCNTIISFQAFDQTSFGFLESYIGKELIVALPNLKQYHAVVCGKGFRSNIPMIVDMTRSQEAGAFKETSKVEMSGTEVGDSETEGTNPQSNPALDSVEENNEEQATLN